MNSERLCINGIPMLSKEGENFFINIKMLLVALKLFRGKVRNIDKNQMWIVNSEVNINIHKTCIYSMKCSFYMKFNV